MGPEQTPVSNEAPQAPVTPPKEPLQPPPSARNKALVWMLVVFGLIVAAIIAFMMYEPAKSPQNPTKSTQQAEALFYDTVQNASKQPIFRVGMFRAGYISTADADAGKFSGVWSSVGELDTTKSDFRSAYIYRLPEAEKFEVGRCLSGRDLQNFGALADRPSTLPGAVEYLKTARRAAEGLAFSSCPQYGVNPGGIVDLAPTRLNDGVFPVGFTEEDAKKWINEIKPKNLFDIKDEGEETKDGKKLRKLSFAPKRGVTGINEQLTAAFRTVAGPNATDLRAAYSFIPIGLMGEGSVKGYYLIDEATKLPVYSELQYAPNEAGGDTSTGLSASFNVIRTKQNYSYGGPLTLDETSALDFVE